MSKQSMINWRKKYPVKAAYATLRDNARRRGIIFRITLQEFTRFCVKTKLLTNRGIKAESFTVDRIDESKGYCKDNLQMLTMADNSRKEIKRRYQYVDGEGQVESGLRMVKLGGGINEHEPF